MPEPVENQGRVSRPVPSILAATISNDETSRRLTLAKQHSKTVGSDRKTGAREWCDLPSTITPSRRKKRGTQSKSSPARTRSRSRTESSKLARILESRESGFVGRPGTKGPQTRHRRSKDEGGGADPKRSPGKQRRVGSVHRGSDTLPPLNPSLLSVLSNLTCSDHSSSSSTTVRQHSYERLPENIGSEGLQSDTNTKQAEVPPVSDYLDATMDDGHDGHSIAPSSSSSSHYQSSDLGLSGQPDTPSSQSTFPSPSSTRTGSISGSVAELRRKYDAQYASSVDSESSGSRSPAEEMSPQRSSKKFPQLRDVAEGDEHNSDAALHFDDLVCDTPHRSASHARAAQLPPTPPQPHDERLKAQQDALRQHVAQDQHSHAHRRVDSAYGQHRSHSSSSTRSGDSQRAWAQYMHDMQMQQYQYASPAMSMVYPAPHPGMHGPVTHNAPPPAPDAPDHSQRTIAGYELLAQELSNQESAVKPMYRRFEYLNHRILLHMQDELQEMEEQLRRVDEIIATMEPAPVDSQPPAPASRRNDKNCGTQWHHQRTELLGRIFLKTKDYSAAVASFASMVKESAPAEKGEVEIYRDWLSRKSPINELETRFLAAENEADLILPGSLPRSRRRRSTRLSSSSSSSSPLSSSSSSPQRISMIGDNSPPAEISSTSPPADISSKSLPAKANNDKNNNTNTSSPSPDNVHHHYHYHIPTPTLIPLLILFLFHLIPTFSGRFLATILIALGIAVVTSSSSSTTATRLRSSLSLSSSSSSSGNEGYVCAVACLVVVGCGLAGCVSGCG